MASSNVMEFTNDNWQKEVVESSVPVLVDFWAPWCGPCRALGPVVDKVANTYAGKVKVGKVNVDDAQELAIKYGIVNIPRLLVFKGSEKPVQTLVGLVQESKLVEALNGVLSS